MNSFTISGLSQTLGDIFNLADPSNPENMEDVLDFVQSPEFSPFSDTRLAGVYRSSTVTPQEAVSVLQVSFINL